MDSEGSEGLVTCGGLWDGSPALMEDCRPQSCRFGGLEVRTLEAYRLGGSEAWIGCSDCQIGRCQLEPGEVLVGLEGVT